MESRELEDLALLFIRDAAEPTMWIDRWAVSYPIAQQVEVSRTQNIETWQQLLNEEWLNIQC